MCLAGKGHTRISSLPQPPYSQMPNCYMKVQGAMYLRYSTQNQYSQLSLWWLREWEPKVVLSQEPEKFKMYSIGVIADLLQSVL